MKKILFVILFIFSSLPVMAEDKPLSHQIIDKCAEGYEDDYKTQISCLKEKIKDFAVNNYSEVRWEDMEKRINKIEQDYINLYVDIWCPAYPVCPEMVRDRPYWDYLNMLQNLLVNMYRINEISND